MSRIKIECLEEDKEFILECLIEYTEVCPFQLRKICDGYATDCEGCIDENVEFVIKEESNE